MKQLKDKEYEEFQQYLYNKTHGYIWTPDTLELICGWVRDHEVRLGRGKDGAWLPENWLEEQAAAMQRSLMVGVKTAHGPFESYDGAAADPVGYFFASVSPMEYANMLYMSVNTMQSMD